MCRGPLAVILVRLSRSARLSEPSGSRLHLASWGRPFSPNTTVSNGPPFPIWGGISGPSASAEFCRSEIDGKLFIRFLSIALTLAGCFALNRALVGKWTCVPLLAFPFLFNIGYTKGFLSFNLGFGIMLCAAAWWTALGESRWRLRLAGAFAFSTVLYVVHFYAWGIYAVFVFGSKLQQILRGRSGFHSDRTSRRCCAMAFRRCLHWS